MIERKQSVLERQPRFTPISSQFVSDLLRQLVPAAVRGKQLSSSSVEIEDNVQLTTDYENVSIRRLCSAKSCESSDQNQDLRTLVTFTKVHCPNHFN